MSGGPGVGSLFDGAFFLVVPFLHCQEARRRADIRAQRFVVRVVADAARGFSVATALLQPWHRRCVLGRLPESLAAGLKGLPASIEIRLSKPVPLSSFQGSRHGWTIYLDGFCLCGRWIVSWRSSSLACPCRVSRMCACTMMPLMFRVVRARRSREPCVAITWGTVTMGVQATLA